MRNIILLSTLMLAAPAFAQTAADNARAVSRMMEADANHDGQVTRAELVQWRAANFVRFDRNGDGLLSPDDIPPIFRASSIGMQLAAMIKQYDANADGRLSRPEFVDGPTPLFDLADVNHDAVVTKAEIGATTARLRASRNG